MTVRTSLNARVHERVTYDAYGRARHHWGHDVNGDGSVSTSGSGTDLSIITAIVIGGGATITDAAYRAEADINRDGVINENDELALGSAKKARDPGEISDRSATGPDSIIGWCGYVFVPETKFYHVRFRVYDTGLGRWISRDPLRYVDGMGLYEYVRGRALSWHDASGTMGGIEPGYNYPRLDPAFHPLSNKPAIVDPTPMRPENLAMNPPLVEDLSSDQCAVELRATRVTKLARFHHAFLLITLEDGRQFQVRAGPLAGGSHDPCDCGPDLAGTKWGPVVPYVGSHEPGAPDYRGSLQDYAFSLGIAPRSGSMCGLAHCIMRMMTVLGKSCQQYVLGDSWNRNSNTAISTILAACNVPDPDIPEKFRDRLPGWTDPWFRSPDVE